MNYANMIEEKNLKKTFIIATLVSTLIGTFASSHNLYERLREKQKQEKKDEGQNQEIKLLKEKVDSLKKKKSRSDDSDSSDDERYRRKRSRSRRRSRNRLSRDNLLEYLDRSPALIRREYDQGYDRWGQRFAAGDVVTQNELQAQIITLQQTVIHVLQDALNNNRQLRRSDIDRLVQASQSAQDGTVDALRSQSHRIQTAGITYSEHDADSPRFRRRSLPAPKVREVADRTDRAVADDTIAPTNRTTTMVAVNRVRSADSPTRLFCRYSLDLQAAPSKNLNIAFAPGHERDSRCPACDVRIPVDGEAGWTIGKRRRRTVLADDGREQLEVAHVEVHVTARFVVKCHTERGEYACVLCARRRGVEVVCADPEALVAHVGRKHKIDEYEGEVDLVQE